MENEREKLEKLKKDAERELKEMRSRATIPPTPPFVKVNHDSATNTGSGTSNGPLVHKKHEESEKPKGIFGKDVLKFLNLENFELDSDRMLLLLMIFLLSRENNDEILLFALAYIML